MVDLANLTSVFEIGFGVHFAFSLLEELKDRLVLRQTEYFQQSDKTEGLEINSWKSFQTQVKYAFDSLHNLTTLLSLLSFTVALYSVLLLIYIGFYPTKVSSTPNTVAALLVAIALLPFPLFALLIMKKAHEVNTYIGEQYKFFTWISIMYRPPK